MQARTRGMTWPQAAEAAGYTNAGSAYQNVKRHMDELRAETRADVEELREVEVARLDRALVEISQIGFDRSLAPERRLVALEALRRNVESRSKLQNLFPTQQVEIVTVGQIERRVAELSHQLGVPIPHELIELPAGDYDRDERLQES